jgi:hypothetical protein
LLAPGKITINNLERRSKKSCIAVHRCVVVVDDDASDDLLYLHWISMFRSTSLLDLLRFYLHPFDRTIYGIIKASKGVSDNKNLVLYFYTVITGATGYDSSYLQALYRGGDNTRPTATEKRPREVARDARPAAPSETAHRIGPGREIMTICGPGRRAGKISRPGPFQKAGPTHYLLLITLWGLPTACYSV